MGFRRQRERERKLRRERKITDNSTVDGRATSRREQEAEGAPEERKKQPIEKNKNREAPQCGCCVLRLEGRHF